MFFFEFIIFCQYFFSKFVSRIISGIDFGGFLLVEGNHHYLWVVPQKMLCFVAHIVCSQYEVEY